MSEMDENQQRVTFTVKELLTKIDGKLDTMALALQAKAEAVEVARLAAKVEAIEATNNANAALGKVYLAEWETVKSDVKRLKEGAISAKTIKNYKRWLVATGIALMAAIATLAAVAIRLFQG